MYIEYLKGLCILYSGRLDVYGIWWEGLCKLFSGMLYGYFIVRGFIFIVLWEAWCML